MGIPLINPFVYYQSQSHIDLQLRRIAQRTPLGNCVGFLAQKSKISD